ncbi:VOC family protein [Pseudochryseolinea flava]|uniref:VOC family protein n=1 Tax=Pseudochryseolinea flava TaxID=2059302 RepID=A0A364Y077_9BACT|nr:VOC family protein [Pseudochryseolinea flava]RAW00001.1 VOC family protein [Pseudochryseolinea flava]
MATVQKITPNLWFDHEGEDAAKFYVSIFKNAKLGRVTRYTEEGFEVHKRPAGSVMTVEFEIEGQAFLALNGGPFVKFNESISFMINCNTQQEVDYYWERLGEGGDPKAQQCGWLKDKFGVSWQVVPVKLNEMIADTDVNKANKAMRAMLQMKKIDLHALEKAVNS